MQNQNRIQIYIQHSQIKQTEATLKYTYFLVLVNVIVPKLI